ncbi:MAG: TauD/TfdA family dioxygenase [Xenococcaceae cyanobacterium]
MKTLDLPTLEIGNFFADARNKSTAELQELARSICKTLENYPHFVVVNGYPAVGDRTNLINLSQAIQTIDSNSSVAEDANPKQEKISFTKVRIDGSKNTEIQFRSVGTNYSRTHLALTPHTDSSYREKPHELVAFQCIVADSVGGESIVIPSEDIIRQLDPEAKDLLRAPVYPLENSLSPIIFGEEGNEHIKYYKAQIERTSATDNCSLSDKHLAVIQGLDDLLESTQLGFQFALQPGQILLIHNTKALHGRTELSPENDRLLYRVRLHVDRLACEEQPIHLTKALVTENSEQSIPSIAMVAKSSPDDRSSLQFNQTKEIPNQKLTEAEKQIALAIKLRNERDFQNAFKHYQNAIALAPNEVEILREFGEFLVHIGKFAIAAKIFQRCLEINPNDFESNLEMSRFAYENENYEQAQEILKQVSRLHPYIFIGKPQPQKPNILRIRSFKDSKYSILQNNDGTFQSILRLGHFSLRDLFEEERYNSILVNIFEDEIDELREIPQFDLSINTIACPDLKKSSLLIAARFVDRYPDVPLINDPRCILETTRERNAIRLNTISGVKFPKTEKVSWDGVSLAAVTKEIFGMGFTFPFIVRKVGSQTGTSIGWIDNDRALEEYFHSSPRDRDYYVIQFHDCRNSQQIFNKIRVFFIDGNFYPVANLFNNDWNIHSGDRYSLMIHTQWTQDAEKSFLNNPIDYLGKDNFNRLCQIRDLINLDFFGIDFTIAPDGSLFVFEANAAMRHNFDRAHNFPYTEPHLKRISNAFENMIQSRLKSV